MRACTVRDAQKELSSLEEEANLPIEEVIRRMKERAEAEGDDDEEEEEEFEDSGEEEDESTYTKKLRAW